MVQVVADIEAPTGGDAVAQLRDFLCGSDGPDVPRFRGPPRITHIGVEQIDGPGGERPSPGKPPQVPIDRLADVAATFRANPRRSNAAVAELLGVNLRMAGYYIRRARDAGLLEPPVWRSRASDPPIRRS